ncbi:MAG: PKD domain-containing protein [Puia sp.]
MKGIPTFCGKLMFLRALLLNIFLLLFIFSGIYAKTVVIGTGAGKVAVQNMNGLYPGDVLAINPGSYSGATFSNLKGITITNNKGAVSFSGTVNLNTLVECSFTGFQFINVTGTAILWGGNSRRCMEKNIFFSNVQGDANNASDHNPYTGDTASLKLFMCTFDSLTLFRSGMVMMGSWGDAASGICFMDSIVFSRIKVDSTITNGTELRGTFFRMDAHDWRVIYKGTNLVLGDVGIFYITGSAYIHNIYRNGGRGYIARIWHCGLKGQQAGNTYFYNNIDLNSSVYGSIDSRSEASEATKYTHGGSCYIFNNTAGNKADNIGYWSSLAVIGTFVSPYKCEVRNNLGFNINSWGHPQIVMNQGSGNLPDSSNNLYFDKPDGVVDPVTGIPTANSPVLAKGLNVSWITDDFYHQARSGVFDIGAVQHGETFVLPANLPPVANAGPDQTITAAAGSVNLNGTDSYDSDGSISNYSWTRLSGPAAVSISGSNTATPFASGLKAGTYAFELTVTDNKGATGADQVTITVTPALDEPVQPPAAKANQSPVANAGLNDTISLPVNTYRLNASGSSDPDGRISSFQWQEVIGPNTVMSTAMDKATADISGLEAGEYEFSVTVTDDQGSSNTATLKLWVVQVAGLGDQVIIYPNPVQEELHGKIISGVTGNTHICIYDMNGRSVLTGTVEKNGITVEKAFAVARLASGMYILEANIGNKKSITGKFIKN